MSQTHVGPLSKQLTIIIGLTVVGFMAFGLALSYYRNVLFDERLRSIAKQNDLLGEDIEQGYRDLEYFRSSQYKDKYAKENLGLVNPGEKVLIIRKSGPEEVIENGSETVSEEQEAAYFEHLRQMPVLEQWRLFFFHRGQVKELQRGLGATE
ncbi:MAG: hypothetical protein V1926_05030 [Candidatus Peregrinibacteria bacterium]